VIIDNRTTEKALSDDRRSERGIAMIVVVALVLLIVYFCALVIDLRRADYVSHALQLSADSAALAAASELSLGLASDEQRWKNAKRAAIAMAKVNLVIPNYDFPDPAQTADHQGDADSCEPMGDYNSQIYANNEIRIEIERGVYEESLAPPFTKTFTSKENAITCYVSASPANRPFPNAVRVVLTIYKYSNFFAGICPFGRPRFEELSRSSLSSRIE
jgi:hypothetical protein